MLLEIIFWICTVLLALCAFVSYNNRVAWAFPGALALIVIDLILIGIRLFTGSLH